MTTRRARDDWRKSALPYRLWLEQQPKPGDIAVSMSSDGAVAPGPPPGSDPISQDQDAVNRHAAPWDQGLLIGSTEEMSFSSLPLFVRQLLDHLPVQVFVKSADITPGKGRQYTYLNKRARDILNWKEGELHYDGEAFHGGVASREWEEMSTGESLTLRERIKTIRELHWTTPTGEWRVNVAIQLPIILPAMDNRPEIIGFCAIAQDFDFHVSQQISEQLTKALLHEYGNFCNGVIDELEKARLPGAGRDRYLDRVEGKAIVATEMARSLLAALRHTQLHRHRRTIRWVTDNLLTFARKWTAVALTLTHEDDISDMQLAAPEAVYGILVQLLANAHKHTPEALLVDDRAPITLSVSRDAARAGHVVWSMSNRRATLTGRLDLGNLGGSEKVGGQLLGDVIRRVYGVDDPSSMITFPHALGEDGMVVVTFTHPLELND